MTEPNYEIMADGSTRIPRTFYPPLNNSSLSYKNTEKLENIIYDLNKPVVENKLISSLKYLKQPGNYIEVILINKYNYRPDLVSLYHYGTDNYSGLILMMNGIKSILNFNNNKIKTKIKLPTKDAIIKHILEI